MIRVFFYKCNFQYNKVKVVKLHNNQNIYIFLFIKVITQKIKSIYIRSSYYLY